MMSLSAIWSDSRYQIADSIDGPQARMVPQAPTSGLRSIASYPPMSTKQVARAPAIRRRRRGDHSRTRGSVVVPTLTGPPADRGHPRLQQRPEPSAAGGEVSGGVGIRSRGGPGAAKLVAREGTKGGLAFHSCVLSVFAPPAEHSNGIGSSSAAERAGSAP